MEGREIGETITCSTTLFYIAADTWKGRRRPAPPVLPSIPPTITVMAAFIIINIASTTIINIMRETWSSMVEMMGSNCHACEIGWMDITSICVTREAVRTGRVVGGYAHFLLPHSRQLKYQRVPWLFMCVSVPPPSFWYRIFRILHLWTAQSAQVSLDPHRGEREREKVPSSHAMRNNNRDDDPKLDYVVAVGCCCCLYEATIHKGQNSSIHSFINRTARFQGSFVWAGGRWGQGLESPEAATLSQDYLSVWAEWNSWDEALRLALWELIDN